MTRFRHGFSIVPALMLCTLASCMATQPDSRSQPGIDDGDAFTLTPGDSVNLANEGLLTYLELVEDSRCPLDVQCIWAGEARIAFTWQPVGGDRRRLTLTTTPGHESSMLGNHRLILQDATRGQDPEISMRFETAAP